jgi:hypothetical protein
MTKEHKHLDWTALNSVILLLTTGGSVWFFVEGGKERILTESAPLYLSVSLVILLIAWINALIIPGMVKYALGLVIAMSNTFLIPLELSSFGQDLGVVSTAGLVYIALVIVTSPVPVSAAGLVSAAGFACYLHYERNVFEQSPVFKESIEAVEKKISGEPGAVKPPGVEDPSPEGGVPVYTVKKSAPLKVISKEVYGDPDYWHTLYEANKNIITNVSQDIPAGTKLLAPADKGQAFKIRYFTVKREAPLSAISALKEVYGSAGRAKYLFDANKTILKDPTLPVLAGTRLIVPELPEAPYKDYFRIISGYMAVAVLAFLWRLLVGKMYSVYMSALSATSSNVLKDVDALRKDLESAKNEYRLLKEETAMHIVEMNQITGLYKDKKPEGK